MTEWKGAFIAFTFQTSRCSNRYRNYEYRNIRSTLSPLIKTSGECNFSN
uniref:Uncharacterized protein n=1 Tax=Arundo donax TaxID=35708 RepID=A0A0A9BPZ4_ARUDO